MENRDNGRERTRGWSVFEGLKPFTPTTTPEAIMAEVDAAIAALEHAHASTLLRRLLPSSNAQRRLPRESAAEAEGGAAYDAAGLADEAYKAACADLAAGKPDSALRSLRVSLASCPRDKASAISKIRALISFASSQQRHLHQQKPSPT